MTKEELFSKYEFVVGFKPKNDLKIMTDQDKKHIRILAILQLAHDNQVEKILNANFNEKFYYDQENKMAYYCIKIQRERKDVKYADC